MSEINQSEQEDIYVELKKIGYNANDFHFSGEDIYPDNIVDGEVVAISTKIYVKRRSTKKEKKYLSENGTNWILDDFIPDVKQGYFE